MQLENKQFVDVTRVNYRLFTNLFSRCSMA